MSEKKSSFTSDRTSFSGIHFLKGDLFAAAGSQAIIQKNKVYHQYLSPFDIPMLGGLITQPRIVRFRSNFV